MDGTRSAVLVEVTGHAVEVVHAYYQRESFARKYMDVPDDPSVTDFAANAAKIPVFRVKPT